ncbi:MAG: hypothetical protein OEX12_08150 [Gammaproteobacteria bacterium]|nr:hypothetical protein [Gammaproteobacteria bacterium]
MNIKKLLTITAIATAMAGCEAGAGVSVNSVGGTILLTDVYADYPPQCVKSLVDIKEGYLFSGDELTLISETWSSTDGTCSGQKISSYSKVRTITNDGSVDAAWTGATPTLADGSGPMATTVSASKITTTLKSDNFPLSTEIIGSADKSLIFIDDTGTKTVVYFGDDTSGVDADGYPLGLYSAP